MTDRQDKGSNFRFEATIKPGEDPKDAETRWYRWNEEVERLEFYGNQRPSWDELSEGARDSLTSVYDLIFRSYYKKERSEAIERGIDRQEFPENRKTMLETLYYLDKAEKHRADK